MKDPVEHHPYGYFIPKRPKSMIIGSFPIGKFTHPGRRHEIKVHEMDFFFGGERNLLWKLIGHCFGTELKTREEVEKLLQRQGIAIGDVISSCRRKSGGASDSQLYDIIWNHELLEVLRKYNISRVYFTSKQVQKWFQRLFPDSGVEEVLLISPSAQSVRSVVRMKGYREWKRLHPESTVQEFIYEFYSKIFL